MRNVTVLGSCLCVLAFLAGSCAPPVVHIEHVIPGALPLPGDVSIARAGAFTVRSGPKGDFADFLKRKLDEHLASVPVGRGATGRGARTTEAQAVVVGGTIDVEANDTAGKRMLRRRDVRSGEYTKIEVPTLVRTAAVRVNFEVRRAAGAAALGTVEVRRSYSSAADPKVRGELGLERADDPARVPPADEIVRRLLAECAEGFGRMVSPVVIAAGMQLRPAPGRFAQLGLDAARKANYSEAVKQYQAAVQADPNGPAGHFDLAAVAEAAGTLDVAAEHYRKAWELSKQEKQEDAEAKQGVARTTRVLAARKAIAGRR